MPSPVRSYIDFMLDYHRSYRNSWKEYFRFSIGFVIAIIVVDFILKLDLITGSLVLLLILLCLEFVWANIIFLLSRRP